jgi:hypothetical protein
VKKKALAEFYISRLLDDHLYQGVLRKALEKIVDESGGDVYKVSKSKGLFESFRDDVFVPKAEEFLRDSFVGENWTSMISPLQRIGSRLRSSVFHGAGHLNVK